MINQKGIVVFEIEKNERNYAFHMPIGAPLGEVYDCAFEVLNEILELAKKSTETAKPKAADSESTDPVVEKEETPAS